MRRTRNLESSRPARLAAALAIGCLLAPCSAALAGIHYKATTVTQSEKGKEQTRIEVEGWIEEAKAKIEFKEGKGSMFRGGTYLTTVDGGRTLYLVDPKEKAYSRWDLEAMLAATGAVLQSMGPLLNFELTDPKVDKLAEDDGGTLLGLPTRHYRYRTSYSMKMKILGMGSQSTVVSEQDIWATTQLDDVGLGVWLRAEPPKTGIGDFDRLIAAEMTKPQGFPLKIVTHTTMTNKKGKSQASVSTMEVSQLERDVPVTAIGFEVPSGYEERPFLPGMTAPTE